jgi:hypothetical protein
MTTLPPEKIVIALREATQTPGHALHPSDSLLDPNLEPPCSIDWGKLPQLLSSLPTHPNLIIELPTPISSPSIAKQINHTLTLAKQLGVLDQVAIHTQMKVPDAKLALECGAKTLFVFASTTKNNHGHPQTISDLGNQLNQIAFYAHEHGATFVRASIEHATQTPPEQIHEFLTTIATIDSELSGIIKGLGIPDTKGIGTPNQYTQLVTSIAPQVKQLGLAIFGHLHNDNGLAETNYCSINLVCKQLGIPFYGEIAPAMYPGERVGLQPTTNYFPNFPPLPIVGPSWKIKGQSPLDASKTHVAGLHTSEITAYGEGRPHPGIYTIMGVSNFIYTLRAMGITQPESYLDILKQTATVARELAAQIGHQPQSWTIALCKLAIHNPEIITQTVNQIGNPDRWLNAPSVDLKTLLKHLTPRL